MTVSYEEAGYTYDAALSYDGGALATIGLAVVSVEIAFNNPTEAPTWTDVTAYARNLPISTRRGRNSVLDRFEAGTLDLTLDNTDRRFEPEYAAGAYYPNVLPMRRVRVRAVSGGTTYHLFTGFVETWPPSYPGKVDAIVTVTAVDGFKMLNLKKITGSYSQELSSVRVVNVLDDAGWPAADRAISTGQSTMQASTLDAEKALQHLQDVDYSENGRLFIDGEGLLVYQDRHTPLQAPYDTSQGTFGDGGGSELPYADIELSYDDTQLWNEVTVEREGGTAQTATDDTSAATYFERTLKRSGLLVTTDAEAMDAANYLLSQYKDPRLRVPVIELKPRRDDALWPHVLGREIGDRITVKRRPPGGGAAIEQESSIEAIEHDITSTEWTTRWRLSPADTASYWILDSLTNSILNSTTRLAY